MTGFYMKGNAGLKWGKWFKKDKLTTRKIFFYAKFLFIYLNTKAISKRNIKLNITYISVPLGQTLIRGSQGKLYWKFPKLLGKHQGWSPILVKLLLA